MALRDLRLILLAEDVIGFIAGAIKHMWISCRMLSFTAFYCCFYLYRGVLVVGATGFFDTPL
jgi:hypothetical protein